MELSPLFIASFVALVANRLVAGLVTPLFDRFQWDKRWLMYIAWALASLGVWLTGVNLFVAYIPNPLAGQVITALVSGGGANLLHDLFDKPKPLAAPLVVYDEDEVDEIGVGEFIERRTGNAT